VDFQSGGSQGFPRDSVTVIVENKNPCRHGGLSSRRPTSVDPIPPLRPTTSPDGGAVWNSACPSDTCVPAANNGMRVVQLGEQRFARAGFTPGFTSRVNLTTARPPGVQRLRDLRAYPRQPPARRRSGAGDLGPVELSERALAEEVGATAYLTKPIGRASFLETVSRLASPEARGRAVGAAADPGRSGKGCKRDSR
jgi:hypothetical protein